MHSIRERRSQAGMGGFMNPLRQTLRRAGKSTAVLRMPGGTKVLILPYGGRVLGLFASNGSDNFFWTHTALGSVRSAREFYASGQWHNSGGDRTWLIPEMDFFFPEFPNIKRYWQQRSLDPGRYSLVKTKTGIQLVNRFTVQASRSGNRLALKMTKAISPACNPLRYERSLDLGKIEYAGYTQHTSLEFMARGRSPRDRVGIWNLLQLPHGGDLLIPTFGFTKPRHIFSSSGTIPHEDLVVTKNLIRYRMRQKGEHKISIRAVSTCSRVGYVHQGGRCWNLIVRNFTLNPSAEYVDAPWDDTSDFGYGIQACNVNSALGAFSELEYHSPAIGPGTDCSRYEDISQVWAFRGSKRSIEEIIKILLTPDPLPTKSRPGSQVGRKSTRRSSNHRKAR